MSEGRKIKVVVSGCHGSGLSTVAKAVEVALKKHFSNVANIDRDMSPMDHNRLEKELDQRVASINAGGTQIQIETQTQSPKGI